MAETPEGPLNVKPAPERLLFTLMLPVWTGADFVVKLRWVE
jgi:hypothetical protein